MILVKPTVLIQCWQGDILYWTMQAGLLMPIILKSVELLMLGTMVGTMLGGAAILWSLTQLPLVTTRAGHRTPPSPGLYVLLDAATQAYICAI